MTTRPVYHKGDSIDLFLYSYFNQKPEKVVVSSIVILNKDATTMTTISGSEVMYVENGLAKVTLTVPRAWPSGTYTDKWNVVVDGEDRYIENTFTIQDGEWLISSDDAHKNLDFSWNLLTKEFRKGSKEYIRIIAKEIYDRDFEITNISCSFIYYSSPYKQEQSEWQKMYWENNVIMSLVDTAHMRVSDKWYVQVKIVDEASETILSPLMKFSIYD
jgi:hypothetical protein